MRWGRRAPRLASSHLVFDTGAAASDRLIGGVTRKIIQILGNSPTTEIARQAYFPSDPGNHLDSSLSPLHDRSSPLRLPQLHRQLLRRSRSGGPQRRLPQLRSRIYRDLSRLCRGPPASRCHSLLQIRKTRNSQKPPQQTHFRWRTQKIIQNCPYKSCINVVSSSVVLKNLFNKTFRLNIILKMGKTI